MIMSFDAAAMVNMETLQARIDQLRSALIEIGSYREKSADGKRWVRTEEALIAKEALDSCEYPVAENNSK